MNNSEILYLYDAKLCNPNGDPDEENRPRMDDERNINLVSDLRLKRYVRDYFALNGKEIFVSKVNGQTVNAEGRVKAMGEEVTAEQILDRLIDVRLFGATMPIQGGPKTFTGPVQFTWGYSLNKVELLEAGITSHFSSEEKNTQGAMGKDYRVKYSLIAFSGIISAHRAKHTALKEEDIKELDQAMRYAIPLLATRSKIGQYPRLYLRVEYQDGETVLGDLRDYIEIVEKEQSVRDITECTLDISALKEHLQRHLERICTIYYFAAPELRCKTGDMKGSFNELMVEQFSDLFSEIR